MQTQVNYTPTPPVRPGSGYADPSGGLRAGMEAVQTGFAVGEMIDMAKAKIKTKEILSKDGDLTEEDYRELGRVNPAAATAIMQIETGIQGLKGRERDNALFYFGKVNEIAGNLAGALLDITGEDEQAQMEKVGVYQAMLGPLLENPATRQMAEDANAILEATGGDRQQLLFLLNANVSADERIRARTAALDREYDYAKLAFDRFKFEIEDPHLLTLRIMEEVHEKTGRQQDYANIRAIVDENARAENPETGEQTTVDGRPIDTSMMRHPLSELPRGGEAGSPDMIMRPPSPPLEGGRAPAPAPAPAAPAASFTPGAPVPSPPGRPPPVNRPSSLAPPGRGAPSTPVSLSPRSTPSGVPAQEVNPPPPAPVEPLSPSSPQPPEASSPEAPAGPRETGPSKALARLQEGIKRARTDRAKATRRKQAIQLLRRNFRVSEDQLRAVARGAEIEVENGRVYIRQDVGGSGLAAVERIEIMPKTGRNLR